MKTQIGELVSHNLSARIKKYTTHDDMIEVAKDSRFSYYTLRNIMVRIRPVCEETYPLVIRLAIIANRNAKKVSNDALQISAELEEWQKKQDQELLERLKNK